MSMPATAAQTPLSRSAEPSMEEILASIRKIIADDQKSLERKLEAQAPVVTETEMAVPSASDNDDAGERAEAYAALDDEAVAAPVYAVPVETLAPQLMDLPPVIAPQPVAVSAPVVHESVMPVIDLPPPVMPAPQAAARPVSYGLGQGLLSDESAGVASASFQTLAHTVFSQNARTLDDLVKDMLKPMLATWLNENLPSLVERLVRAEIERVARGGN
jgi:cell pole-organizing protein PopZ